LHGRNKIGFLDRYLGTKVTVPLIDYLNDPVVIASRDGTVTEVNKALLDLIDLSRDSVIGKDCSQLEPLRDVCNLITSAVLHKVKQKQRINYRNVSLDATVTPMIEDGEIRYVMAVLQDVSSYVSLEAEFLRKNRELIISNTLSSAFITSDNIESVFSDLLEKALVISHLGMGWIMLKSDDSFELKVSSGLSSEFKKLIENGGLDRIIEKALSSGAPLHVLESEDTADIKELRDEGVAFLAVIPLRSGYELMGCLVLSSRIETAFDFDLASLLSLIGNNLSMIADKIKLFQETQRLAITDGLTGIYNVRFFYDELEKEIARSERYSAPFSLALFDIDDFKEINDTFGHQAGDEVLRHVAENILNASRKSDIVARYGGEEFISILPSTTKDEAYRHACRIKDAVERDLYLGENSVKLTISGGISTFPGDASDAKSLLYAADMAMYKAKSMGKKIIYCYGRS
jgi:diguanylate cyclase (GGDEF)-like protein/PAS domain S-box-containing protein